MELTIELGLEKKAIPMEALFATVELMKALFPPRKFMPFGEF